ncbi:MAG: glycosyltransferase family 2 protein [Chloroflexota bacterium]
MSGRPRLLPLLLLGAQAALAVRVYARLQRSAGQRSIVTRERFKPPGRITIVVPALDDLRRLGPCLRGLHGQGPAVTEIIVADRGSSDGTPDLVRAWEIRDHRIRCLDARAALGAPGPVSAPAALAAAVAASPPGAGWILVVGPGARPKTGLGRSMLGHALRTGAEMLSLDIPAVPAGALDGAVLGSLAAAADVRFGTPGGVTRVPALARANADCLMIRRDALADAGGFEGLAGEAWEFDLARRVAARGRGVGFAPSEDLIGAEPPANPAGVRAGWAGAAAIRAANPSPAGLLALAETALVQAAPLPLALLFAHRRGPAGALGKANLALFLARGGLLGAADPDGPPPGRARWLGPLADLPVTAAIAARTLRPPR